jgi:chromosome segregation protein
MFLTKLELVGFKSFATKTVLEFPRGITAIVGPNGSGKSNIIDAIRWLLGERDAKNLRGGKGEDLIFAGTPSRARMGMAQAALYFDNTSKFFPVDYEEVSITRQVNRDGISQYYLNKAEVRLKDVVDFFAHSRLGTKGLIIIGQGQSDIFIRATPQERREMVEEILGLRQFQLKKNEAERKLRHTLDNAAKVSALIEEIAPHLRLLKRQTAKWERRAEIAAELRGLEMAYFAHKIRNLKRELRELEPRAASLEHTLLATQEEFKAAQDKLKKAQAEQIPEQKESEKIMQLEQELQAKHSTLERELARSEARLEYLEKQDAGDSLDANTLKSVLKNIEAKLEKALSFDFDALRLAVREVLLNIKELFKRGLMRESETEMSRLKKEIGVLKEELRKLDNEIEK